MIAAEPTADEAAPSRKRPRVARPDFCRGCLVCVLRCSLRLEGAFAPGRASLRVVSSGGSSAGFSVMIMPTCDGCGLCARHCPYGVLEMVDR